MKKTTISKAWVSALRISTLFTALLIGMQLFLASPARSQSTGSIKGTVTDSKGITIPGVTVKLEGATTQSQNTDTNGNYSFTGLSAGNYTLTYSFLGYTPTTNRVTLAQGQQNVTNTSLTADNTNLEE